MQSQSRPQLSPRSVQKPGWPFRVVEFEVREQGICTLVSSVVGCGLTLGKGKTSGKLSSVEAVPKEGWQLKAVCRHHLSTWGSKSFRRSFHQFHMASPFAAPLALLGREPNDRVKFKFVSGLWLSSFGNCTGKGVFWQSQMDSLVFSLSLELRLSELWIATLLY